MSALPSLFTSATAIERSPLPPPLKNVGAWNVPLPLFRSNTTSDMFVPTTSTSPSLSQSSSAMPWMLPPTGMVTGAR
jgi:hypothetical protein